MVDFASSLSEVKGTIAEDKMREVRYEFEVDESQAPDENSEKEDVDLEWMSELEIDGKGKYLSSSNNLNLIFAQDPRLKKLFSRNEFDGKSYLTRSAPWRRIKTPEVIKNVDFAGVRNYIESVYGITGTLKVEDAMVLETERQLFHPIKDYFSKLTWDGEKRVETLLVDYFGVDDTAYHREAITKMLTGAVARVFRPGVKFDLVLTLVGGQGLGKSTFVKKLGLEWFSDTFMTVHGKEALEQIQGAWIIEIAELSGMRKADVEAVKHFISKQVDTFRPAYARTSETYPRQCVFFGTTNKEDFLRDPSGNRRFMPVRLNDVFTSKDVFSDLTLEEVNQIWAEAFELYKKGEPLYLSTEAELLARESQKEHSEEDERKGIIEAYLETPVPSNWSSMDLFARRLYLQDGKYEGSVRNYVCIAEVWSECLGKEKENMDRYKTREINDILRGLDNWEQPMSTRSFNGYGKQRFYKRIGK
jgi:predicted P-loop ATPase